MKENKDFNLSEEEKQAIIDNHLEKLKSEDVAVELSTCLQEFYGLAKYNDNGELLEGKVNLESDDYPDYYAGSYFDEFDGLVIMVTGDIDKAKKELCEVIGDDGYQIRKVDNSYKEMTRILEAIDKIFFNEKDDRKKNIIAYGISEKENKVFVELEEYSDKSIAEFKTNVVSSDIIAFEKGETPERILISPGVRIGRTAAASQGQGTAGRSSVGYRARRNGRNGIVVSGHGVTIGSPVFWNGRNIGQPLVRQVSGSIDAAFVPTATNISLSNAVSNGSLRPTHANSVVGMNITRAGMTTRISHGRILATGVRLTAGGITNTHLVRTNARAASGDSGGPFFVTAGGRILGIAVTWNASNQTSTYCTSGNIQSILRAVPY